MYEWLFRVVPKGDFQLATAKPCDFVLCDESAPAADVKKVIWLIG